MNDDYLWSVPERRDHGFVAAGFTESFGRGGSDIWIVGIDSTGKEQWRRTIGDARDQSSWDVKATSNGEFVVAGRSASSNGNVAPLVVRVDPTGIIKWQMPICGSGVERIFSVAVGRCDTVIVAGTSTAPPARGVDVLVAKLAPDGTLVWRKTLGGPGNDIGHSVVVDSRGTITVAGYAPRGAGPNDITLTHLDRGGSVLWNRVIGGPADDRLIMLIALPDPRATAIDWCSPAIPKVSRPIATYSSCAHRYFAPTRHFRIS